jgi:DNA-binding CsgD family transcriptional regulator
VAYLLEDFVSRSNECSSREELFELYRKAINKFGFDRAVYTFMTDHKHANQKAGHGVQTNYPDDWMSHYMQNDYVQSDPVIMWGQNSYKEFRWDDIARSEYLNDEQRRIMHEVNEAGLKDGVGIPLHGPRGEFAGVGMASSDPGVNNNKDALAKLRLLTEQFHVCYCDLSSEEENVAIPVLTPREREMLQWWAIGKTTEEIAIILNCSQSNVRWHIRTIYQKLDANTKILAVTKAIRMGIIALDLIKIS